MWPHLTFSRNSKSLLAIDLFSRVSSYGYYRCQEYATDASNVCTSTQTFDWSKLKYKKSNRMKLMSSNTKTAQVVPKKSDILLPYKPEECCGEECESCVWLLYVNEIIYLYKGDLDEVEKALKCIPNLTIQQYVRESIEDLMKPYRQ